MDEMFKDEIVHNLEIGIKMEEHTFMHEEVFKHKSPEVEHELYNSKMKEQYSKIWRDSDNNGLMTDIAPSIPYTNAMADNGKLNYKQKRERNSMKKTLKAEFKRGKTPEELRSMTQDEWDEQDKEINFKVM